MTAAFSDEIIAQHQLTPGEYQKVVDILGRQPTYTELGIFASCGASIARTRARACT